MGALFLFTARLAPVRPEPTVPEREPILVRLPRAALPPPPPRAAPVKAAEPKPRVARKSVTPPPLVAPPVTPPPPEEPVPVEEEPDEAATEEASAEVASAAPAPVGDSGRSGGVPGGIGDGPLELRDVARPPSLIERVTPEYPRQARSDHIEGLVLLRAIIGKDGRVEKDQIRVVRSVPALDGAAIAALGGWRFSPAIDHQGRPVRVIVEIPFQFTLS